MQLISSFHFVNIKKWLKPISQVLIGQSTYQLLGIVISFILVRGLTKQDFAVYTVLTSIQAMLNIISASGIMMGFQKIGGKIWNDNVQLSSLINTATSIRIRIFLIALVIVISYGYFILSNQNIPFTNILFFLIAIVLIVIPETQKSFYQNVLHLKKRVGVVSLINVLSQLSRLLLIGGLLLFSSTISIEVVLIATVLSTWQAYYFILNKSNDIRIINGAVNNEYKSILYSYINRNWHNAAFFAFSGQISLFLIGVFGSTTNLANLGALTRYSQAFLVINALINNIFVHEFARNQNKEKLIRLYFLSLIGIFVFSICVIVFVLIFSDYLLIFLGEKYYNLHYELFLVFISSLVNLLITMVHGLNSSKGWIKYSVYWDIPVNILSILLGLLIFEVDTLQGVLSMSIFITICKAILTIANSIAGFKSIS